MITTQKDIKGETRSGNIADFTLSAGASLFLSLCVQNGNKV
jgi:hypothetical protein